MNDLLMKYVVFLMAQLQEDMNVIHIWWVYTFVLPLLVYFAFFFIKWIMLLAPITVPLMLWRALSSGPPKAIFKKN
jgi:hypothetical protein